MIRRTRRYLLKQWGKPDENGRKYLIGHEGRKVYFPEVEMKNLRYDINKVYQKNYKSIIEFFEPQNLKFARYHPGNYLKKEFVNDKRYQDLVDKKGITADLMKIIILKRLDSSLRAFKRTINDMRLTHEVFLNLLEKGRIPIGKDSNVELRQSLKYEGNFLEDDKKLRELEIKIKEGQLEKGNLYNTEDFRIDEWKKDIESDIADFKEIQKIIEPLQWKTDDKINTLQKLLNDLKGNKILIFSEYADTTLYLNDHIKWGGIKTVVTGDTKNKMSPVAKFAPEYNSTHKDSNIAKKDEITLLIATNTLSEGVNLQSGSIVINYDFFWNPTRLIQRQGRIDRLDTKHDKIKIFNFLPDPDVEKKLHVHEIIKRKIDEIHRSVGMDSPVLEDKEVVLTEDPYAGNSKLSAAYGEEFEKASETIDSGSELEPSEFESIITQIKLKEPDTWKKFSTKIPDGIRSSEGDGKNGKLLICCESGNLRHHYIVDKSKTSKKITANEALEKLQVKENTPTSKFPENYNELVATGFNKFKYDLEQVRAKSGSGGFKPSKEQNKIIARLQIISRNPQNQNDKKKDKDISDLSKGFKLKLSDALSKELRDVIRNDYDDEEFIKKLSDLHTAFKLWKVAETEEDQWLQTPRILYSKYYFDKN